MKRTAIIIIASALLPLAGHAEEKPLWEIQGRLGEKASPRIDAWLKELFIARGGIVAPVSSQTMFRIAGFENGKTPESDWLAEVRGLSDMKSIMEKVEAGSKPDGTGRFLVEREGVRYLVWQEGDSVLRLAGPPESAGISVAPAVPMQEGECLSGWVDLLRLNRNIESKVLKTATSLSFSVAGAGEGVTVDLDAGLVNREAAEIGKALAEDLTARLAVDGARPTVTTDDNKLKVRFGLSASLLDKIVGEMKAAIEKR